jgi:hypothetical protein
MDQDQKVNEPVEAPADEEQESGPRERSPHEQVEVVHLLPPFIR